jgi:surfactin synthase thioesterase subunit
MTDWFLRRSPRPHASMRLFAFPFAGAGASVFNAWHENLDRHIELLALQPPGRGARFGSPLVSTMTVMANLVVDAMRPFLDKPYAIFGHSIGALTAFEVVRTLRHRGLPGPTRLFASAKRAPHLPPLGPQIHGLPDADFIQAISAYEGMPPEVLADPDLLAVVTPILRSDFKMSESYRHEVEAPLDCDLSLFGSVRDPFVPAPDLQAWAPLVSGKVDCRMFAPGHFFVATHAQEVIAAVNETLASAAAGRSAAACGVPAG